jgi:uncharacterized membrane protein
MLSETHLKNWLGIILQASILISIVLVFMGGVGFLWQHGNENLQIYLALPADLDMNILTIWHSHHLFSPFGLIELGLLVLVIAQVLRVALLTGYYVLIRDYWFTVFSLFILSVILYSLIWQ